MKNLIKAILVLTVSLCVSQVQADAVKLYSNGTYVDKNNAAHPWTISEHHSLVWDGNPYVPAGGVFYSRYLSEGRTEENWQEDVKALELLKSKGVTDLLLKNVGPASWVPAESWQKMIDYLDANSFTYGLDLADSPKGVLTGYVVRPNRYRLAKVLNDGVYTFNIPDATSAFYVLASPSDASVIRSGSVQAVDGKVSLDLKVGLGNEYVLVLYPELDISGHGDGGIPNVWDGYDAYRDRLITFLSKLKYGKGLRFFLDPFDVRMSMVGNLATAVPNSQGFKLEFEAWLKKKYPLPSNVASAWGLVAQDFKTIEETARLVPLWYGGKGVAQAFDPTTGTLKSVMVQNSTMWDDLVEFRDSSIRSYMNSIADVLKKQVADVPVVFRMGDYYRVYANTQVKGGYDGLAVDAFGKGDKIATDRVGPAYSLSAESAKTMWTIVSSYMDVPLAEKKTPGFSSQSDFAADMDLLRESGAKGIFVLAMQMSPKVVSKNYEMIQVPDQLGWLADFNGRMKNYADFSPKVVYYPSYTVSGAVARRLGSGTWWLPSLRPARTVAMGDDVLGYSFTGDDVNYIWSINGPMTASLKIQKGQQPLITHPEPVGDRAVIEGDKLVLKLDKNPLGVRGITQNQLFPMELAQAEVAKLDALIAQAEKAEIKTIAAKEAVGGAKRVLKNGSAYVAYDMAHTGVLNLKASLTSYAWLEGEAPIAQNFDRTIADTGANYGRYLLLNTDSDAPMAPYGATYNLGVPKEGTYNIWLAGYVPGDNGTPLSYSIDGGDAIPVGEVRAAGAAYGPGFNWVKIGETKLSKGEHSFAITVTGRRKSDNRYTMAIDAIMFTTEQSTPEGTKKP